MHDFKVGAKVKVFNGGRLEGIATIERLLSSNDNYYGVHFEGDNPRTLYKRWVLPRWQEDGFDPSAAGDFSLSHYGVPREAPAPPRPVSDDAVRGSWARVQNGSRIDIHVTARVDGDLRELTVASDVRPDCADLAAAAPKLAEALESFAVEIWSDCRLPADLRRDFQAAYYNSVVSALREAGRLS